MKRIAVVNRSNFKNYGSVLQCLALCEAINKLGYDAELIWTKGSISNNYDLRPRKIIQILKTMILHPSLMKVVFANLKSVSNDVIEQESSRCFDAFVKQNIRQSLYTRAELKEIVRENRYYKYVCGSDQIWNPCSLYLDPLLFLRFAPRERRVAYAPSLGCDNIPDYNKNKLIKFVLDIPKVSIREEKGRELLKDLLHKDYPVVLDPTLLHDRKFWDSYSKDVNISDYILCYFLNQPSKDVQEQISYYALSQKKKVVLLYNHLDSLDNRVEALYKHAGPSEFLGYVSNASYVITDSYHGMLFSLIFEKKFSSIARNYKEHNQSSRQMSILKSLGLQERHSNDFVVCGDIDYDVVNMKINKLRDYSLNYLKESL